MRKIPQVKPEEKRAAHFYLEKQLSYIENSLGGADIQFRFETE